MSYCSQCCASDYEDTETQLGWDAESFVQVAGYDDEENWLDIGTVKGYKRVVMCQEVREEIRTVLGEQTCIKDFLLAMCDDRLQPTPWLNKVRMLTRPAPLSLFRWRAMLYLPTSDSHLAHSICDPKH